MNQSSGAAKGPARNPARSRPLTTRGQHTRQLLLGAAEEVFGERGYDQAAISEITRRAGVAQGTFYVHFPDKKEAFVELVKHLNERLREEVFSAIEGLTDRMAIERARFDAFFRFVRTHRNLYRIVRQAEFVDEELYRWYYRSLAEGYAQGLQRSIDEGQVRPLEPEALAYCLMGIADFVGMRWGLWEGKAPPPRCFDDVMSFIHHGLAGPTTQDTE